jgi:hypothetical protein
MEDKVEWSPLPMSSASALEIKFNKGLFVVI